VRQLIAGLQAMHRRRGCVADFQQQCSDCFSLPVGIRHIIDGRFERRMRCISGNTPLDRADQFLPFVRFGTPRPACEIGGLNFAQTQGWCAGLTDTNES